ncbi:MAG: cupin domain-containing protein [Thermoleophilia bacterium]|nr:cupin domain-containing protein [Thermoleophilia bacterium]
MRHWDLSAMDVAPHHPEVLHSAPEGRAIAIALPAGEALGDHQVHETAWLVVASGRVALRAAAGDEREAGAGSVASFDPAERHEVRALEDSRLLLLLTPWPAPGRTPGVDA